MFKKYRNPLTVFLLVVMPLITLLFLGCKNEKKPIPGDEQKSIESITLLSGEKYGYIKNIFLKEENYFVSIVFLDYQLKSKEVEAKQKKISQQFPDSLEVLELPDAYLINAKGKSPDEYLVNKSVRIVMQTLNYDSTGNFKFNENADINKFIKLFTAKEFQRYKKIPFKINLSKNEITSIAEQYVP
ncbi:MAG: hypothetical protein M0P61_07330 [Ignavibacteriaceae bacterium]|jgi:hypothetical protein|nr:hypothetical protein [Ignavibacteriaceae bacterium]